MKKYCTQIDNNGFIINTFSLTGEEISNFDGRLLIDIYPPAGVDMPLKPKWTGTEWVEGATQEEIDEHYKGLPPLLPSNEEKMAQLEQENKLLKLQNQANMERMEFVEDLIAEIAMKIYE